MLMPFYFWCATILLCLCAGFFIIPPLWIKSGTTNHSARTRATYTGLLVFLLVCGSLGLYCVLGNAKQLVAFYDPNNVATQQSAKLIRPLYAKLQRNLVKYELNLPIDINDVALILSFAQGQAQDQSGILPQDTQKLLLAVLKAIPKQVTALNLLAIHAYNTDQYAQAIQYWEEILTQFTPELRNTAVERVLIDKIKQTRHKLQ